MRSTSESLSDVIRHLRVAAQDLKQHKLLFLCEVEIGLLLQEKHSAASPAEDAWVLFSGYPFARAFGVVDAEGQHMIRAARYTLWTWGRRMAWSEALQEYQRLDRHLRAYEVTDPGIPAVRRSSLSVAPDRWSTYESLLNEAPAFSGLPLKPAKAGPHVFPVGRTLGTVEIPEHNVAPPVGHDLGMPLKNGGEKLTFCLEDLRDTAEFMDTTKPAQWVQRMTFELFTRQGGGFQAADLFEIAGIQHMLGIVGAGKSTLRDVLAVHMARKGLRSTIVVGDVAEQLKLVAEYNTFVPGSAAPVLGATSREQHAERLHRRLAGRHERNLLIHDDPGFAYLSTSCALNAARQSSDRIADDLLNFGEAPCAKLRPPGRSRDDVEETRWSEHSLSCPLWSCCPRHHVSRELVDALIWVATPASLVDSSVPHPQNRERIRYLELACRRSDLIVVDEADRVQMQLDRMFAPATTLIGGGPDVRSFLDDVNQHRIRELAEAGRTQLSDRDVESWSAAVNTTQTAVDRLVAMLVRDVDLRRWVRTGYFSAWTLQLRLLEERFPLPEDDGAISDESRAEHPHREPRRLLTETLDEFRKNPFGDRRRPTGTGAELTGLLGEILHTNFREHTRSRLEAILRDIFILDPLLEGSEEGVNRYECLRAQANGHRRKQVKRAPLPEDPEKWLNLLMNRFEFTLLLSALEPKLTLINAMWPRVAPALNLGFNEMYRRPSDYGPMVPEAPMGNVLGFQFLMDGPDRGGVRSGELRFFRCSGVGRELLRAMPGLPTVDGRPGTNVLLMSGSSWAGKSSRYHVPVPIGMIIKPDPVELERIAVESNFRIEFVRAACDCRQSCECHVPSEPLRISGVPIDQRATILRRMAVALGRSDGKLSRLEQELRQVNEDRKHILLLVGSYEEAKVVADTLHTLSSRWRDRVYRLVADDDPDAGARQDGDEHHAPVLRRGDVETLASTRAEVLVAPLLAVERGHNILNIEGRHAAIGSIYFLARPNPRPDDLGLAVHAINDWIVRAIDGGDFDTWVQAESSLGAGARKVRDLARSQWYRVLARRMAWSGLKDDREQVTWDLLVLIWQVIGRSVRGAVPTRVAFVDAAFAPNLADGLSAQEPDTPETSLLLSMHAVLKPYFTPGSPVPADDRHIVQALYRPLWSALDRCLPEIVAEGSAKCID
ncbi:hypothetical protein GCM10022252_78510 [Streptosporangium oxazolinicum]|uniref:pPIWI-RE three-gene island domain-containing protein n=1 Tax=Streptosporangium oxazolinicum TaxID=909287 RepID=A0ABP8BMK4_9ACTN